MWPVIKPKYSAGKRALNSENRRIYQITPYTLQPRETEVRIEFRIPENPLVQIFNLGESLYRPTGYILYDLSTSDSGLCSYLHFRVLQFQLLPQTHGGRGYQIVRIPSSMLGKCVPGWKLNPLTCSLQYSNIYGSYDCKQGYSSLF